MQKLCVFLVLALACNLALGMNIRQKRQAGPTTMSSAIQDCIRNCPVTAEYNPVCGTNNNTYDNPGRLICARDCGVDVAVQRTSRCPAVQS